MEINFAAELKKIKKPAWNAINSRLPKNPSGYYKIVNDYPKRQGKYFRPALLIWSAKMFGGKKEKALLPAAAMQVSEDWLLVHDDFLDHSLERRGSSSLNVLHGDEIAVNAGDSLHLLMWKLAGEIAKQDKEAGWQIYEKFFDILKITLEGQFLEVSWIKNNKVDISEKEYYKLIDIKAGYYTVTGPLQLGAIAAGAPKTELEKIKKWGIPFGRAFQIRDDVINVTVATKIQGKEKGGDVLEGKRTLLLIHLLKNCKKAERKKIIAIYKKKRENKNKKEMRYVMDLMQKYGSIKYADKKAKDFAARAIKKFNEHAARLPDSKEKNIIRKGIEFVASRNH